MASLYGETDLHVGTLNDSIPGEHLQAKQIIQLLLALILGLILICWQIPSTKTANFPLVNPPNGFELVDKRRSEFVENSRELLQKGRDQNPGKPFNLMTDGGEITVLPASYSQIIRNVANLDFLETIAEDFNSHIPGFETFKAGMSSSQDLLTVVVRKQLTKHLNKVTKPLSEETSYAIDIHMGKSYDWRQVNTYETVLDLVARMSSRVFLGQELCRDKEWLEITKSYTVNAMFAAGELRVYPNWLRNYVHWFNPKCQRARAQLARARDLITSVLNERIALQRRAKEASEEPPHFHDAIAWFEQEAAGQPFDKATVQLTLSMAAIHTTSDLLTKTLMWLTQKPDLVAELRKEIATVLRAGGWQKNSLFNMKLLDSTLKETQRLEPPGLNAMTRKALVDYKLPTGEIIPKGARLCIDFDSRMDPSVYPDPSKFDGHRFERWRGTEKENAAHLVATGPHSLAFGHGQHACPGRFFAANELKVALCHLLMKYDWKLPKNTSREPLVTGFDVIPNPEATIMLKRRDTVELDVDRVE